MKNKSITANKIIPNSHNPRTIKDDNFKKLVQSLKDFPEMATVRPVVIDENNMILGGNMRFAAMKEAGWDDIPITQVRGWSEEQKREFIIKDNVRGGEWDWDTLANEWEASDLEAWGVELPNSWDTKEIVEDEAPEPPEEPISKYGEVYQLGRHRLMCGDATKIEDVEKLMDGNKADMVFTDPPYGIAYKSPTGSGMTKRGDYDVIEGDDKDFDPSCLFGHCEKIVTWGANHYADKLPPSAQWLVWDKREGDAINNNSDCELAWCSFGGSARLFHHKWNGMIKASEKKNKRVHPTQKPIALCSWSLNETEAGNNILDLFGGSGSTLIACEQTDRTCYMMELDPRYCDVIRKRYENFINNVD